MDHVVKVRSSGTVVSISGLQRNALTPAGCHGPILFLQIQCHSLERVARALSLKCLSGICIRSALLLKSSLSQRSGLVAYLLKSETIALASESNPSKEKWSAI